MKIFWSWQVDTDRDIGKAFVENALKTAAKEVGDELILDPSDRPDIDHDTKDEPGTPRIIDIILGKIERSGAFCADVTPIGESYATDPARKKLLPNPNVVFELGYARRIHPHQRILLVANTYYLPKPEALPFDLRADRAPMTYRLAPGATDAEFKAEHKKLVAVFNEAIKRVLDYDRGAGSMNANVETQGRSTWFVEGKPIGYTDHQIHVRKLVQLRVGPHAYMRIDPSEWPDGVRSAHMSPDGAAKFVLSARGAHGDWGQTSEGFLYFLARTVEPEASPRVVDAVAHWFSRNGSLWGVWADMVEDGHLFGNDLIQHWTRFLLNSIREIKRVGGRGPFIVRAGVSGIEGARWYAGGLRRGPIAAKANESLTGHVADDPASAFKFVAAIANRVTDAFGIEKVLTEVDVANSIGHYLPRGAPASD